MPISIVLALVQNCIVKMWESCCEVFDILLLYQILFVSVFSLVSYRNMHLPIVVVQKRHCLPTNYQNSGVKSLNFTSV